MTGLEERLVELGHSPVGHDYDQQSYISPPCCSDNVQLAYSGGHSPARRPRHWEQIVTPNIQDNSGQRAIHTSRNIRMC